MFPLAIEAITTINAMINKNVTGITDVFIASKRALDRPSVLPTPPPVPAAGGFYRLHYTRQQQNMQGLYMTIFLQFFVTFKKYKVAAEMSITAHLGGLSIMICVLFVFFSPMGATLLLSTSTLPLRQTGSGRREAGLSF